MTHFEKVMSLRRLVTNIGAHFVETYPDLNLRIIKTVTINNEELDTYYVKIKCDGEESDAIMEWGNVSNVDLIFGLFYKLLFKLYNGGLR